MRIFRHTRGKYASRARHPLVRVLNISQYLVMGAVAAGLSLVVATNRDDEVGYVGTVVAEYAQDMPLDCGEDYDAESIVIFHPTLACNTLVQVTNPNNGKQVTARVVSNTVMYLDDTGRTADISSATATKLGLKPESDKVALVSLRPLTGKSAGILSQIPVMPSLQPSAVEPRAPAKRETAALTNNILGECGICSTYGRLAVAQVTLNRARMHFRNKKTIHAVVYDRKQFSWTIGVAGEDVTKAWPLPGKNHALYKKAERQALNLLNSRISGKQLSLLYRISWLADHYYAFDEMKTPGWGKRKGNLEVVPMPNTLEVELQHRFFRAKGSGFDQSDDVAKVIEASF